MKLSIVIPAHNEEDTIAEVLKNVIDLDLKALGVEKEIIVVDDGSSDRTAKIVKEDFPQALLIENATRQGKGSSIRRALECSSADTIIIQDADLEYDPKEYPRLLEPIIKGRALIVYGSRFLSRKHPQGMHFLNYLGNRMGTLIVNLLYGSKLTDLMTGYKVLPKQLLGSLGLCRTGFDICAEITAKTLKKNLEIFEVPISYQGRSYGEGKKISLKDAFFILTALCKYRFTG